MTAVTKHHLQQELEAILDRLKRTLKLGYELKVQWIPSGSCRISGEVRSNTIFIYDEDREVVLETLKHEFIDYAISKVVEPYQEVTNRLIALVNDMAYARKEKLVEAFIELIAQTCYPKRR